eukprot:6484342-Amphidinium_carterae.3
MLKRRPDANELQRANQEIWRIVSDNTHSGLVVNTSRFPAAVALESALKDNNVAQILQSIPAWASSSVAFRDTAFARQDRQFETTMPNAATTACQRQQTARPHQQLPSDICFAFNCRQCKVEGKGCASGRHV